MDGSTVKHRSFYNVDSANKFAASECYSGVIQLLLYYLLLVITVLLYYCISYYCITFLIIIRKSLLPALTYKLVSGTAVKFPLRFFMLPDSMELEINEVDRRAPESFYPPHLKRHKSFRQKCIQKWFWMLVFLKFFYLGLVRTN